jgi:hypothetical protein
MEGLLLAFSLQGKWRKARLLLPLKKELEAWKKAWIKDGFAHRR